MKQENQHNKEKSPELRPITDRIISIVLSDCASVMDKKQVEERLKLMLYLMSDRQRENLLKRLSRCVLYIEKIESGLPVERVRSILKRKYNLKRQNIDDVCKPCELYLIKINKK